MKCDIVIPVWNKKELTKQCVDSIFSSTHCDFGIIIVDNASDNPTREYLDQLKENNPDKVNIIRNKENLGNTKAANQGILSSKADYICILDNDTIVFDGWLDEMMKIAESNKDIGIVNPANNFGRKKPWNKTYKQCAQQKITGRQGRFAETATPVGFCYLIKREVIDRIGLWDERFSPGYFEDTEYALRAKKAGYKSVFALGAYVFHLEHTSFKKRGFNAFFKKSEEKFYNLYKKSDRILYILSKTGSFYYDKIKHDSYVFANNSSWVWIFLRKSAPKLDIFEHTYIRAYRISDIFFNIIATVRVLIKKKKFSQILVDDKKLADMLTAFKKYHKAEVQLIA